MNLKWTLWVLSLFWVQHSFAVIGGIPTTEEGRPATDLIYNGKLLTPTEALELGKQGVDLSKLDPAESDVWKRGGFPPRNVNYADVHSGVFEDFVASPPELMRFQFIDEQGQSMLAVVSKKSASIMLRKTLLEKLGFHAPHAERKEKLTVKFDNKFAKEEFLFQLGRKTLGKPDRWIVEQTDEEVILQDVVLIENNVSFYTLIYGLITSGTIQARRALNSLLIPFSLVDVPESVNLLSWVDSREQAESIRFGCDCSDNFNPDLNDGLWMLDLMKNLTESDIREIVASAELPSGVAALLTEKLKSRILGYYKSFNQEAPALEVNATVSLGDTLVNGKLVHQDWPGYGARFTFGDPESPISKEEIGQLFNIKVRKSVIEELLGRFSEKYLINTDITEELIKKQRKNIQKAITEFATTGKVSKQEFGFETVPTVNSNVFASRDVVVGKFTTGDGKAYLSDSFGVSFSLGAYAAGVGLPTNVTLGLSGGLSINRVYSHLSPVVSLKAALKKPYKNMIVPLLYKKLGDEVDAILSEPWEKLDTPEGKEKLKSLITDLKKLLPEGESLMISTTIGAAIKANAGYNVSEIIKAQARFEADQALLNRIHIHRRGEDEFQLYDDEGNSFSLSLEAEVRASTIPIITLGVTWTKANAEINQYALFVKDEVTSVPDTVKKIKALGHIFKLDCFECLQDHFKNRLKWKLKDRETRFGFLFFRHSWQKSRDKLKLISNTGFEKDLIRLENGSRSGVAVEPFAYRFGELIFKEFLDEDIRLSGDAWQDPGNTVGGSSFTRASVLEYEKNGRKVEHPIIKLRREWSGWRANRDFIRRIVKKANKNVGKVIFNPIEVKDAESMALYYVGINMNIYESGFHRIDKLKRKKFEKILKEHWDFVEGSQDDMAERIKRESSRYYLKRKKYKEEKDASKKTKKLYELVAFMHSILSFKGMQEVFGEENIYLVGSLSGYREKDERGDKILLGNSIGKPNSKYPDGIMTYLSERLNIPYNEFYATWLVRRL